MKPTDFSKYIADFLSRYLPMERGLSSNTINVYKETFILLLKFMKDELGIRVERLTIKDITKNTIIDFLDWLQTNRNCTNSTRNLRLSGIKSFFKYLQYQDLSNLYQTQKILNIKSKKAVKKAINYLTLDGVKLLLEQPDTSTSKGIRDLALLSLLYDSGARVQEIIDLTPAMLRLESPCTVKVIGKGNKSRTIPLVKAQTIFLKNYMNVYFLNNSEKRLSPLFFNNRKEKLSRAGVSYILKKYMKKARETNKVIMPTKVSCHSLRHSKAMHLLQAGLNLIYIRDILGHVSVTTTEIYARADSRHKRIALEKAYMKSNPNPNQKAEWIGNENLISWLKRF